MFRFLMENKKREDEYFQTCREDIAQENYQMSQQILNFLLVIYVIILGMALLFLDYFTVHPVYYLMFPILFVVYIVYFVIRKRNLTAFGKGVFSGLFYLALFVEIIMIDDLHDPGTDAAWFPVLIVLLPAVLIARMRVYVVFESLLAGGFLVLSYLVKTELAFRQDIFSGIASVVISLLGAYVILQGRIKQGLQYQQLQKMKDEAAKAKEEAERANKAKSDFLSRVSHEIRTPINAILGMNEIILRDYGEPKLRDYSTNIKQAGKTLLAEINDILDFSKIEAGRLQIIEEPYDLSELVSELHSLVEIQAEKKNLGLTFDIDPGLPRKLCGDEKRIRQCALNLLTNSVKYTEEGNIVFKMNRGERRDDRLDIYMEIADTGVGIAPEDMTKLMAPFERLDEEKFHGIEGTGLGLPIVEKVLTLMGAKLQIESEPQVGSRFFFTISQRVLSEDVIGRSWIYAYSDKEAEEETRQMTAPNAWVLVIDDNEMNLMVAKGLLTPTRIHVDTAASGADAILMCNEVKYDMIFIDQRMPKMSGTETLEHIRALEDNPNANVPCIALTADAIVGAREKYISAGFDDYLTKPFPVKNLLKLLLNYLPPEKIVMDAKGKMIDEEYGKINCGDEATYELVRSKFFETLDEKADEIEAFYKAEDWENYGIKVHALKTSARLLGCKPLSEMALALEKAADEGDSGTIHADTQALLDYYRKLKEEA